MQLLVIKLTAKDAIPQFVAFSNKKTEASFEETDWVKLQKLQHGRKTLLLIPNRDVLLTEIVIPSKNRKQMMQALPFALEDSLAEDIEDLHFSAYRAEDSAPVKTAVINHQKLGDWVDYLKSHDLTVNYILPGVFSLPVEDSGWAVSIDNEEAQIRTGALEGFACDTGLLEHLLPDQMEDKPPEVIYVSGDSLRLTPLISDSDTEIKPGVAQSDVKLADIKPALELNLLNNYNRGDSALKAVNWTPWKPVAAIAGLLFITWVGMFFWKNNQLKQQVSSIETSINKAYREVLPKSRLSDPDQQLSEVKRRVKELKGQAGSAGDSMLPTVARIAPLLNQFKQLKLKEISFKRNKLLLNVETPNLGMLEQFEQAAEAQKLDVNIAESKTTAKSVIASLEVGNL